MGLKKKPGSTVYVLSFLVVWTVLTVLAVTWGFTFDWPDYVHIDYGFPVAWATHTLNTIAGPVDVWKVNLQALVIDLAIWLGLMAASLAVILQISSKKV